MAQAPSIEARSATFYCDFAYKARLHQVAQIVIGCGPRGSRIETIDALKDFRGGGMPGVLHKECHDTIALRSAAQAACFQRPLDFAGIHGI